MDGFVAEHVAVRVGELLDALVESSDEGLDTGAPSGFIFGKRVAVERSVADLP